MTKDLNKNISSIQYNSLNLPSKVIFSDGKYMDYVYSATGEKRSVTYNVLSSNGSYTYCDNFIYYNGALNKILVDGGYISISGSTPTYHYYLKDHLGNNRLVVDASGTVKQVTHYYPFGGFFGESTGSSYQAYKYNGKEFERLISEDWYDYGARHMSPNFGRFTTMDPMAEKYYSISPYAYCLGNPVCYIDEHGDSCIVLLAPNGANGYGHMAIGIQNSKGEWCLYSKNGTNQHFGLYGEEPPIGDPKHNDRGEKKADNLYDFLHDTSINPKDENGKPEYTEGFLIATTPEQDKKMEKGALNVLNQDYDVLSSNCAQTVQRALKYGGLNPGNGLRPKINVYPSIVKNNKGAQILIYNPQLSPKKW